MPISRRLSSIRNYGLMLAGPITLIAAPAIAQDANNPIDPAPTLGVFNRFYADDFSRFQLLGNATFGKTFVRVTTEQQINYDAPDKWKGGNVMVARLFEAGNGKHQIGLGGTLAYVNDAGVAVGVSAVTVSKFGKWKVITLTTIQAGDDIFSMEIQPGLYHDLPNGWYFRSHPRMLLDFENDVYEIPIGAGIGKIFHTGGKDINLFIEPQYDVSQDRFMTYAGMKILF